MKGLLLLGLLLQNLVKSCDATKKFGRISSTEYILTPKQIEDFHENGCCTIPDVLTEEEVHAIEVVFDKFLNRKIRVPGKDFCDMSKPFDTKFEDYSIVNCMLPTKYYPPLENNIYEKLIHDEYVIHGSSGNRSKDKQRRTYVVAFRPKVVVDAERKIGFTHSHNDVVNWDTFNDIIKKQQEE